MKKSFFILLLFVSNYVSGQVLIQFKEKAVNVFSYEDGDEFNDTILNINKWNTSYPWGRFLYCSQDKCYYSDGNNFQFDNGNISIIAKSETIKDKAVPYEKENYILKCNDKIIGNNLMTFNYTSGMLFSKKQYLYGYYEIKFKLPLGSGLWPAFWLFGNIDNEEIDIFEISGRQPQFFHVDVHCKNGCDNYPIIGGILNTGWGANLKTNLNWSQDYNVIGIEWNHDYIQWFLNGHPAAFWKGHFSNPMSIIANLAVTADDGKYTGNPQPQQFPKKMLIDYIRYWKNSKKPMLNSASNVIAINKNDTNHETIIITKKRPVNKKKILNQNITFVTVEINDDKSISLIRSGNDKSDLFFSVKTINDNSLNNEIKYQLTIKDNAIQTKSLLPGLYNLDFKLNKQKQNLMIEVK